MKNKLKKIINQGFKDWSKGKGSYQEQVVPKLLALIKDICEDVIKGLPPEHKIGKKTPRYYHDCQKCGANVNCNAKKNERVNLRKEQRKKLKKLLNH